MSLPRSERRCINHSHTSVSTNTSTVLTTGLARCCAAILPVLGELCLDHVLPKHRTARHVAPKLASDRSTRFYLGIAAPALTSVETAEPIPTSNMERKDGRTKIWYELATRGGNRYQVMTLPPTLLDQRHGDRLPPQSPVHSIDTHPISTRPGTVSRHTQSHIMSTLVPSR